MNFNLNHNSFVSICTHENIITHTMIHIRKHTQLFNMIIYGSENTNKNKLVFIFHDQNLVILVFFLYFILFDGNFALIFAFIFY